MSGLGEDTASVSGGKYRSVFISERSQIYVAVFLSYHSLPWINGLHLNGRAVYFHGELTVFQLF